jgi:hypothetical protein
MGLLAERLAVGIGRIAGVGPLLVGIRPFGRIRIGGRVVERVVRVASVGPVRGPILAAILGIAAGGLGEPGGGFFL